MQEGVASADGEHRVGVPTCAAPLDLVERAEELVPRHGHAGRPRILAKEVAVLAALVAFVGNVPLVGDARLEGHADVTQDLVAHDDAGAGVNQLHILPREPEVGDIHEGDQLLVAVGGGVVRDAIPDQSRLEHLQAGLVDAEAREEPHQLLMLGIARKARLHPRARKEDE